MMSSISIDNFTEGPACLETPKVPTMEEIEELAFKMLAHPEAITEMPVNHSFTDGKYVRQIFMKKGDFVIGHKHRTEHDNVVIVGHATVLFDGAYHDLIAPCIIRSKAGCRKVLFIHEGTIWATVHDNPDNEIDIEILEARLIDEMPDLIARTKEVEQLRIQIASEIGGRK